MSPHLPPSIRRFLCAHITSLEHLEILMLLRDRGPLSPPDITRALASSPSSITRRIKDLAASTLVASSGDDGSTRIAYAASGEHAALLEAVIAAYKERRLAVIEAIYSTDDPNLQSFSDAFKIVKDPPP